MKCPASVEPPMSTSSTCWDFNQQCSLGWEKLFQIAVGVARGLEYLHQGCNTKIVHFDIKPQNILLDEDFSPKISDYGLAKFFKKKQSMISTIGARGTVGYIAPEVFFRSFGAVSHKSDVYSYGMTLLEMAEARKFVESEAAQSSKDYFPDKLYEYVLLKNRKLGDLIIEEEEETKRKMLLVGLWCIQAAPADRPSSMMKVVQMLEGSMQSIRIPPNLTSSRQSVPQYSSSVSVNIETDISLDGLGTALAEILFKGYKLRYHIKYTPILYFCMAHHMNCSATCFW